MQDVGATSPERVLCPTMKINAATNATTSHYSRLRLTWANTISHDRSIGNSLMNGLLFCMNYQQLHMLILSKNNRLFEGDFFIFGLSKSSSFHWHYDSLFQKFQQRNSYIFRVYNMGSYWTYLCSFHIIYWLSLAISEVTNCKITQR